MCYFITVQDRIYYNKEACWQPGYEDAPDAYAEHAQDGDLSTCIDASVGGNITRSTWVLANMLSAAQSLVIMGHGISCRMQDGMMVFFSDPCTGDPIHCSSHTFNLCIPQSREVAEDGVITCLLICKPRLPPTYYSIIIQSHDFYGNWQICEIEFH